VGIRADLFRMRCLAVRWSLRTREDAAMTTTIKRHGEGATAPGRRWVRRLTAAWALGLGLALVPVGAAGASTGTGLEEDPGEPIVVTPATPVDGDAVLCYYDNKSYSVGSLLKFPNEQIYECASDGTWKKAPRT
jgi:hypothetical protein